MKNLGIYIHVPFCRKKCDYCNFYSIKYDEDVADKYVNALIESINLKSSILKNYTADTIYFGGGTPSLLKNEQLKKIMTAVKDNIDVSLNAEISIESNPIDISDDFFICKTAMGFNRFSIGVQTLNKDVYKFIGRNGGFADENFLNIVKAHSDLNISLDYISGVNEAACGIVENEIQTLINAKPKHFSVYLLSVEKNTPLFSRFEMTENHDANQADVYLKVKIILEENNYHHYEISNFCLKGFESRHNLKYWNFEEYAAFGPSAHSFMGNERWSYANDADKFINGDFSEIKDIRCERDAKVEYIMTSLRLRQGLSLLRYSELFNSDIISDTGNVFSTQISLGGIEKTGDGANVVFKIPDSKILISDVIIEAVCGGIL